MKCTTWVRKFNLFSHTMAYQHFKKQMRMELSILRKKGYSMRAIAQELGVSHSSVVRELQRNAGIRTGEYNPGAAHTNAYYRRKKSKYEGMKVREVPELEVYVKKKLELGWTPEQISGRLRREQRKCVVSHVGIYKWIYSVHGLSYAKYLPSKRYRPRKRRKRTGKREIIKNRVFIELRPKVINERKRLGDFEGDTLGRKKGTSATLAGGVDRRSRFLVAKKVSKPRRSMEEGYQKMFRKLKIRSLTLDNGFENVRYESLGVPTYFCHPFSSWQKGTIENTFQRLRRYIPKGSDLSNYSDKYIASVVDQMNNTPRKCLGYKTPAECFKDHFS